MPGDIRLSDDAHKAPVIDHRNAPHLVLRHRVQRGVHVIRRITRDRIKSHASFERRETSSPGSSSFHCLVPDEPVSARCDCPRMEQVLNNLLGNAVKYSPETRDVEVALECAGANAVLSVTDHGIGIAPSDRSKSIEPFRRGQNVGNIGGSGLGLSVARKIVEAHGGTIEVRSEPGSGSVFTVRLPLVSDAEVKSDHAGRTAGSAVFLMRN